MVIQAAGGPADAELEENNVSVRLRGNTGTPEQALRVSDGPAGNAVTVQDDSQAYLRTRRTTAGSQSNGIAGGWGNARPGSQKGRRLIRVLYTSANRAGRWITSSRL